MRQMIKLLAAAATTLLLAFPASAADPPPFPRLAGVNNGAPHNYYDPAYQAKLAKLNWSLIAIWVGGARVPTRRWSRQCAPSRHQSQPPGVPDGTPWKWTRTMRPRRSCREERPDELVAYERGSTGSLLLSP